MNKLSMLAVVGLMVAGFANAQVPVKASQLKEIVGTKPVSGLRAQFLTLNQNEAGENASFTLTEDTGIRCFRAPCPSTKETDFTISDVKSEGRDTVKYTATEVLKNIPPNVRIARRTLEVKESSMELVAPGGGGFMRRESWLVRVTAFPNQSLYYSGSPQAVGPLDTEME